MKILSWNVNSVRARLHLLEDLMHKESPDVILLQETKVLETFPFEFFQTFGYKVHHWGQKSYNGVAIAARFPMTPAIEKDFLGHGEARYLECTIAGIRVASVYVPNGGALDHPAYAKKLEFMHHLAKHLHPYVDALQSTVVAGDFNIALSEEDVAVPMEWEGRILCSQAERNAMRCLLHEGWGDLIQGTLGKKNPYTWWPYQGKAWEQNKGLRIDYMLLSPFAMDRCQAGGTSVCWRGEPQPSDHAPVWAELRLEDSWK
jgi:exodeoxyribonuclease-3